MTMQKKRFLCWGPYLLSLNRAYFESRARSGWPYLLRYSRRAWPLACYNRWPTSYTWANIANYLHLYLAGYSRPSIPVYWYTRILVDWYTGMPVYWHTCNFTNILVFGVGGYWNQSNHEFWVLTPWVYLVLTELLNLATIISKSTKIMRYIYLPIVLLLESLNIMIFQVWPMNLRWSEGLGPCTALCVLWQVGLRSCGSGSRSCSSCSRSVVGGVATAGYDPPRATHPRRVACDPPTATHLTWPTRGNPPATDPEFLSASACLISILYVYRFSWNLPAGRKVDFNTRLGRRHQAARPFE